jgi:hypothetical protein
LCSCNSNFDLGYNSHREAIPSIITYANDVFDYSSGDLRHIHETVMSKLEVRYMVNLEGYVLSAYLGVIRASSPIPAWSA